jgi:hypothetical protein
LVIPLRRVRGRFRRRPRNGGNRARFHCPSTPALSPEEDEASLRAAGFSDVRLFYAAFTFRGWVAYA